MNSRIGWKDHRRHWFRPTDDSASPTRNQQHFKHVDDSTEPKYLMNVC